jgi:hypothetical protein
MNRLTKRRKNKANLRILVTGGILVICVGLILFAVFHKSKPTVTVKTADTTDNRPAPAPNTVVTSPAPTPTTNVPGGETGESDTSQVRLTAPSGTFVSNHGANSAHPVTSGTTELSSCNTSPGATCYIKFTNTQSGATAQLSTEQTSATGTETQPPGTVSWSWTPAQENLTTGNWTIEAVAGLGGQTETTTDPTVLTISP